MINTFILCTVFWIAWHLKSKVERCCRWLTLFHIIWFQQILTNWFMTNFAVSVYFHTHNTLLCPDRQSQIVFPIFPIFFSFLASFWPSSCCTKTRHEHTGRVKNEQTFYCFFCLFKSVASVEIFKLMSVCDNLAFLVASRIYKKKKKKKKI